MSELALDTAGAADQIADFLDDDGQTPDHGAPVREQEEIQQGDAPPVEDEAVDTAENDTDEVSDEPDDESVEGDSGTDDNLRSLNELADALEMPLEEVLANMSHTFKANGEEITVNLDELTKSYQRESDYRKKTTALAEERRGFEAEAQQRMEEYQATSHGLAQQIAFAEQMVVGEMNSHQMALLREQRPDEWTARMHEQNERLNMIRGVRQKAATEYSQFTQQSQQEFMIQQGKILGESVEGWGEEKLGQSLDVMRNLGFNDDEIVNFGDARFIQAALRFSELEAENAQLRSQIDGGSVTAKKIKETVPKVVKGQRAKLQNAKGKNSGKLKQNLKKTALKGGRDNMNAAAAMIENLL